MKYKIILLFVLPLMVFTACNKDEGLLFLNLDGEFIINLDQQLTANGPQLNYLITTVNPQECQSSQIIYTLIDAEGELNLTLEDITLVDDCPTEEGIVEEKILFNIDEGLTDVAISLRDVVKNKGTIETTASTHTLTMTNPKGIVIGNTIVNRLPKNLFFGYIENVQNEKINDVLLDSLATFGNSIKLTDGYYTSFFSIQNDMPFFDNGDTPGSSHKDVYFFVDDKESFIDYIQDFKDQNPYYIFNLIDAATGDLLQF